MTIPPVAMPSSAPPKLFADSSNLHRTALPTPFMSSAAQAGCRLGDFLETTEAPIHPVVRGVDTAEAGSSPGVQRWGWV